MTAGSSLFKFKLSTMGRASASIAAARSSTYTLYIKGQCRRGWCAREGQSMALLPCTRQHERRGREEMGGLPTRSTMVLMVLSAWVLRYSALAFSWVSPAEGRAWSGASKGDVSNRCDTERCNVSLVNRQHHCISMPLRLFKSVECGKLAHLRQPVPQHLARSYGSDSPWLQFDYQDEV